MPITNADGVIVVTPAKSLNTPDGQSSGVSRAVDFAVADTSDVTKQLQVDMSEAEPGATIVLKAPEGATGTIELTLPDESGAIGGSGDVVGPASATANAIAIYSGTTGKLLKNSSVTIADDTTVTSAGGIHTPAVIASSAIYTDVIRTGLDPSDEASIQVRERKLKLADGTTMLDWSSGAAMGASGSFTTTDGKTVTVVNGMITEIEGP